MGGSTANIRTLRIQSVGPRTLASILTSSSGGAGSFRRVYRYYQVQNKLNDFYSMYNNNYGKNNDRNQLFLRI